MAEENPIKKQFLDSAGLSHFWGIIKSKFATKAETLTSLTVAKDDTDPNKWSIVGTYADNTEAKPHNISVELPTASATQAGLMTKDQVEQLNSVVATGQSNIIEGIELADDTNQPKRVELKDKIAKIGLKYETSTSEDGKYTKAYISLVDLNGGENPAVSKIDVTELTKTGLLAHSDVVIDPEGQDKGTYLKLTFNVVDENGAHTQIQYINVTSLIDIYTGGEGINVNGYEISIIKAEDSKLGGIKTGYTGDTAKTYAVKVDGSGNAYVAVNWGETVVSHKDEGKVIKVEKTDVTDDVTTYTVSAGDDLTSAINNANAAIQKITLFDDVVITKNSNTVDATTIKTKLGLGTAAYVDVADVIADGLGDVATSGLVKSYVDGAINTVNGSIDDIKKDGGIIDTKVAAGVADAVAQAKNYTDTEIGKFVALTTGEIDAICV